MPNSRIALSLGICLLAAPAVGQDFKDKDPFSFLGVSYTYARFDGGDAGDGVTRGVAASKSYGIPDRPLFLAGFAQFSRADDELKLVEFGGIKSQIEQNILRMGLMAGWEFGDDKHLTAYALAGREGNVLTATVMGFENEDSYNGWVYGGGALFQITERNLVDLRVVDINYSESETASYNTFSFTNYYLAGDLAVSVGVSYNGSPSVDTTAVHLGLTLLFDQD